AHVDRPQESLFLRAPLLPGSIGASGHVLDCRSTRLYDDHAELQARNHDKVVMRTRRSATGTIGGVTAVDSGESRPAFRSLTLACNLTRIQHKLSCPRCCSIATARTKAGAPPLPTALSFRTVDVALPRKTS